jgi:malate dehydrogenase
MKISFIGAGDLGSQTAFLTTHQAVATEVVLLDIQASMAQGRALDIGHSLGAQTKIKIMGTDNYLHTASSDIVVVTAGKALVQGNYDRNLLWETNKKIVATCVQQALHYSPNAIFVIVTNPVYKLCTWLHKQQWINPNKLIGFGSSLDTLRYAYYARNPNVIAIGDHDADVIAVGATTELNAQVGQGAKQVIDLLGGHSTVFAPGIQLTQLISELTKSTPSYTVVGKLAEGEFGLQDVVVGLPCWVNNTGIIRSDISHISLTSAEQQNLQNSAAEIKLSVV